MVGGYHKNLQCKQTLQFGPSSLEEPFAVLGETDVPTCWFLALCPTWVENVTSIMLV